MEICIQLTIDGLKCGNNALKHIFDETSDMCQALSVIFGMAAKPTAVTLLDGESSWTINLTQRQISNETSPDSGNSLVKLRDKLGLETKSEDISEPGKKTPPPFDRLADDMKWAEWRKQQQLERERNEQKKRVTY